MRVSLRRLALVEQPSTQVVTSLGVKGVQQQRGRGPLALTLHQLARLGSVVDVIDGYVQRSCLGRVHVLGLGWREGRCVPVQVQRGESRADPPQIKDIQRTALLAVGQQPRAVWSEQARTQPADL